LTVAIEKRRQIKQENYKMLNKLMEITKGKHLGVPISPSKRKYSTIIGNGSIIRPPSSVRASNI
jgi:hypothetical protein